MSLKHSLPQRAARGKRKGVSGKLEYKLERQREREMMSADFRECSCDLNNPNPVRTRRGATSDAAYALRGLDGVLLGRQILGAHWQVRRLVSLLESKEAQVCT